MSYTTRQFLDEAAQSPEYWAAAAALTFTENLNREMERQAISRAQLAKRLRTSRAYVTRVMRGDVNFTLETMAKLALAVGARIDVTFYPSCRKLGEHPIYFDPPSGECPLCRVERAEARVKAWEEDALLRAKNKAFWLERAERAEARVKELEWFLQETADWCSMQLHELRGEER